MKYFIKFLTIFSSLKSYSQNNADAIIGKWINIPKQDLIIEVYKIRMSIREK